MLQRRPPAQEFLRAEALWQEAKSFVDRSDGLLILDGTTLDKPHANQIEHVTWHWSGKHGDTVKGINLLTLLWGGPPSEKEEDDASSDEENEENEETTEAHFPCDFRLYNRGEDGLTKNDHFRQMLDRASERDFDPEYVVFDSWYSGLDNLKKIRSCGWDFFTRLKSNRLVNPDDTYNRKVRDLDDIPEEGRVVHLKGFGFVRVFRTGSTDGDAEDGKEGQNQVQYWATNDLDMTEEKRAELARRAWGVETYHRQLKQYCGAESSQHRSARAQHNHVLMSIRAFLRLEVHRLRSAVSFYKSQAAVIRKAVRAYLADPAHILPATA